MHKAKISPVENPEANVVQEHERGDIALQVTKTRRLLPGFGEQSRGLVTNRQDCFLAGR